MSKKVIKYFFELVFIFIIPLLILVINCNYENTIEYDNNGNFQSTEKHIEFTAPFTYIKEPTYINYLDFNQLVTSPINSTTNNGLTITNNSDGSITIDGTSTAEIDQLVISSGSIQTYVNHKYLIIINNTLPAGCGLGVTGFYLLNGRTNFIWQGANWGYAGVALYIPINTTFSNLILYPQIVDLTQLSGSGYELTTLQYSIYFPNSYYEYTLSNNVRIDSDEILSEDHILNYTVWGRLKNSLINNLELQDNFVIDFIISYTILWFIMFIIWHIIYLLFDKLFHIRKE